MKHIRIIIGAIVIVFSAQMVAGIPQSSETASDQSLVAEDRSAPEAPLKSAYLTDRVEVTFRAGPGIEYRILAMVPLGQRVNILEEQDQWTKIRTDVGREGWVSNRFIGREVPGQVLYDEVKTKYDQLAADYAALEEEAGRLQENNREIQEKLDSGVSVPKERLQQLLEENRRLKRMADKEFQKWFLAGAGVLLAGFLVGCWVCREKRRTYFK